MYFQTLDLYHLWNAENPDRIQNAPAKRRYAGLRNAGVRLKKNLVVKQDKIW